MGTGAEVLRLTQERPHLGFPVVRAHSNEAGFLQCPDPDRNKRVLLGNAESNPILPIVISTAACLPNKYTGHMEVPQTHLVGPVAQVLMIPSNRAFSAEEIRGLVRASPLVAIFGGSHPGPGMVGGIAPTHQKERDGGYDTDRDWIEFHMIREAIRLGKPLMGVCRGFQTILTMLCADIEGIPTPEDMDKLGKILVPAAQHHRAEPDAPYRTHPLQETLPEDMRHLCPWIAGFEPVSHHSIQVPVSALRQTASNGQTFEANLRKRGWLVAAVDGTPEKLDQDRSVEVLIHVNEGGDVDGYLVQSHPEKPAPGRPQQKQWYAQHRWSQEIVQRAIERQHRVKGQVYTNGGA